MLQQLSVTQVLNDEAKRSARGRAIWIGAIVVVVAGLAALGWMWWSSVGRVAPEAFATDTVAKGDIHVTLVVTGTFQPTQEVPVSASVSGIIESVDVDYNEAVKRGQALAHLDMRDLEVRSSRARAMVEVQKANVLTAETNLADAQAALKRAEALVSSDGVTQRDIDLAHSAVRRAEAALASARAQQLAAEADLQSALNDVDKGAIVSPIDGVVLDRNVVPGQNIGTASLGSALFTIAADLKRLDLEVDIDEADVAQVVEGDRASFTVEAAPDRPFAGKIRQIRSAPSLTDGVVSYKALIDVDNASLALRPGMTATADIAVDEALGVLTVPNAALRYTPKAAADGPFGSMLPRSTIEAAGGEQTVWVLADGVAKPVAVTVGLSDGQRSEVTGGELHEGDVVITGSKAL